MLTKAELEEGLEKVLNLNREERKEMMSVMDGGDDELVSEEEWVEGLRGVQRR